MRADRKLSAEVVAISRALHERGWVANHDGNITVKLADNRFLATPTATSKRLVATDNLIEVDRAGTRLAGTARPFSELVLHIAVYGSRTDVGAVVHAHPPHATAIACTGRDLLARPFIAEAVVSLGPTVPLVPFTSPGPDAARALAAVTADVDAALLANHGVIAWGADLEHAYLRLELVEHLARIALLAEAAGGIVPLPDAALAPLLASRARAGLGDAADRAVALHAPATRADSAPPAPHTAPALPAPGAASGNAEPDRAALARVIREELLRALADDA